MILSLLRVRRFHSGRRTQFLWLRRPGGAGCYAVAVSKEQQVSTDQSAGGDSASAIVRRLGPAAVLAGLWAVTPFVGLVLVGGYSTQIAEWLKAQGEAGLLVYIACFAVGAGLGLLPTWIQAVMGGYVFGLWRGFAGAEIGFVLAALIAFVVSRTVARERAEREIASHPKARVVRDALVGRGFWGTLGVVTLVRLNSPFALTNLVLAASGVRLVTYVVGTAVGLGVRTFIAVQVGSQLTSWGQAEKPRWLVVGGIVAAVAMVVVIGQVAQRAMNKLANGRAESGDGASAG